MEELYENQLNLNDQSPESEQTVLGAALIEGPDKEIVAMLHYKDFYSEKHQYIWRSICYQYNNGNPTDVPSVIDVLKQYNLLEHSGGAYYLTELIDIPTAATAKYHARRVKECAVIRKTKELAYRFVSQSQTSDISELRTEIDTLIQEMPANGAIPIKLWDVLDYVDDDSPEPKMILDEGIFPERGVLILGGQPKTGKSLVSMNIAMAIATGDKWLDFDVSHERKVLILQAENSYYNMRRRIKCMVDQQSLTRGMLTISDPASLKINDHKDFCLLEDLVDEHESEVLIIDPLVYFHSVDENDNAAMGMVMEQLRNLANNHNVAIIIVHHAKKAGMVDSTGGSNLRGASSVFGSVDTAIILSRDVNAETDEVTYSLDFELRNGENPERMYLSLDQDTLQMNLTQGALPDLSTWLINTLNNIQNAGMDQKMVVSMAEEQGFKAATVKRKINKLIEEETVKTDNAKRNRRLWYHPHFNDIPY